MHKEFQIPSDFASSVAPWIVKTAKLMSIFLKEAFAKYAIDLTKEQFILLKVRKHSTTPILDTPSSYAIFAQQRS